MSKIKLFILFIVMAFMFTGCYIPPNTNVGRPAPHNYHNSYYSDYYYR